MVYPFDFLSVNYEIIGLFRVMLLIFPAVMFWILKIELKLNQ